MKRRSDDKTPLPAIIQGGMGIGVSNWELARAVSMSGQLGVVSGTALSSILVRRLQDGDADGSMRRALGHCPLREASERIVQSYWIPGGKPESQPYRLAPMYSLGMSRALTELTIVANFVEIHLAKEGHDGVVGLNLLEKLQLPTLASLFGAMLAGVDVVLMGAGIPRAIPGVLDRLAAGQCVRLRVSVDGAGAAQEHWIELDPSEYLTGERPTLHRPQFLAIVSSSTLAATMARKASGRVDGFVIEGATAGGHNAPPRGAVQLNERGEPVYGPRDIPDLAAIRGLGLPFWLAGSHASPEKLREAMAAGATGVQIGTAFAFCEQSGMADELKEAVLAASAAGTVELLTDARASPTGMPFKVVAIEGTVSDPTVYNERTRACDLGYLRQPYLKADGSVGYRCPAEPVEDYVRKGGAREDTDGRKCLCNGLLAAVGLGQALPASRNEPAVVTAGEDAAAVRRFLPDGRSTYAAEDVLRYMVGIEGARE